MSDTTRRLSRQRMTERDRGNLAWQNIEAVGQQSDEVKKKYRTQARQFSSLVRINGLAQTLAFLYAKGDWTKAESKLGAEARAVRLMLVHLDAAVLKQHDQPFRSDRLLRYLLSQPSQAHREATVEALAFTRWLSRFAEAELPSEEESSSPPVGGTGAAHA